MNKIILLTVLILLTYISCETNEDSTHCNFTPDATTTKDTKLSCLKRTYDVEDFEDYRCCWITYNKGSDKVELCDILRFKESKIDEYRDDLKDDEDAKEIKILCSSSYLLVSFVLSFVLLMF